MIALGNDHAGLDMMQEIMKHLDELGLEYRHFGTYTPDSCNYPEFSAKVANAILSGECERGILICGTGIGITIAANRFKGIRAANCANVFMAKATREHNDANILGLGARVLGIGTALEIVDAFLATPFSEGERHIQRIRMMDEEL